MTRRFEPLQPLTDSSIGSGLFRAWLGDGVRLPGEAVSWQATQELERALAAEPGPPRWLNGEPPAAEVVVTGQQPGLLGGPLYTLLKIATTIALAGQRTAAGRTTVPVFWSADDDDDWTEAFETVAWIPGEQRLRRLSVPPTRAAPGQRPRPVGDLPVAGAGCEAIDWIAAIAALRPGGLADDLLQIHARVRDGGGTWRQLRGKVLERLFPQAGLRTVSGGDASLHAAAAPLYERILATRSDLSERAAERGDALRAAGWHAQIQGGSLHRPLFRMRDGRREHLAEGEKAAAGDLRPGVLLRSPVQDWLLRPAAVVVGPGELAYLRQLDPVYAALQVEAPARVARLFAWCAPAGLDPSLLTAHGRSGAPAPERIARLADQVADRAATVLGEILARELEVDTDRAEALARGRARRIRKGVASLLAGEARRAAQAIAPRDPVWVFPQEQRQERTLAASVAAALWGEELIETLLAAADDHLRRGRNGDWTEYRIEVE